MFHSLSEAYTVSQISLGDSNRVAEFPDSPEYWIIYHKMKRLQELGYITLERRSSVDWEKTNEERMQEIETSVQSIFLAAVANDPPPHCFQWNTLDGGLPADFHCKNTRSVTLRRANRTTVLLVLAGAKLQLRFKKCKVDVK